MAVSCPEVMYGAYYPYLYGRGAARSFHHAPHFQYDRFNVQGGEYGAGPGSASSGAVSPASPPRRTKEEDLSLGRHSDGACLRHRREPHGGGSSESEAECGGARARAQYVSANCVVFTHYSGDVAAVVDEHFTRALAIDKPKESVPMGSRNLPASFFNAAAPAGVCAPGVELYEYDPWHQHYTGYGPAAHAHAHAHAHAAHRHAAAAAEYNMAAAGYPGLLLPRSSLAQYPSAHAAHLDPAPYSYPAVPGLEAQVQDTSKDLYWF